MVVGIVGYGVVGQAVANAIKHNELIISDPPRGLLGDLSRCDLTIVCVPTPMKEDGSEDTSIVEAVVPKCSGVVMIKSTVLPGTTNKLAEGNPDLAHSPEFLTQANALQDFLNSPYFLVGTRSDKAYQTIESFYKSEFPDIPIYRSTPEVTEMIKLMDNAYFSLKVTLANEIYDLCTPLGIDYEEVRKLLVLDPFIADDHLKVSPERGFGGACLPKDAWALVAMGRSLGIPMELLEAALAKNSRIRAED